MCVVRIVVGHSSPKHLGEAIVVQLADDAVSKIDVNDPTAVGLLLCDPVEGVSA